MKEFKKFFNKSVGIDEKVIIKTKDFYWSDPSGEYSLQITKEPTALGFSVFYVENNTEFKMLLKDANELSRWLSGLLESKKVDENTNYDIQNLMDTVMIDGKKYNFQVDFNGDKEMILKSNIKPFKIEIILNKNGTYTISKD